VRWIENRRRAVENWLGPFFSGLIEGIGSPLAVTLMFWGVAESRSVAVPAADVFRDLAQIGAALLIAFAVATTGASKTIGKDLRDHLNWLGVTCGLGLCGFLAVAGSVALTAHRKAGHSGWLDILGLCWAATCLGLIGILVAFLPYAAFRWSRLDGSSAK
jgi:hypothetical protein